MRPLNGMSKTIGRIGTRNIYGGLDGCEDVLGSVLSLPSKGGDVLLVALSICDVSGDF
jgi:hypothetical protein